MTQIKRHANAQLFLDSVSTSKGPSHMKNAPHLLCSLHYAKPLELLLPVLLPAGSHLADGPHDLSIKNFLEKAQLFLVIILLPSLSKTGRYPSKSVIRAGFESREKKRHIFLLKNNGNYSLFYIAF
jgi:hypothetical protein